jgi:acetoin utilization deacetylase AcuC-like enzyme
MPFDVVYSKKQVGDTDSFSPSPSKPKLLAKLLQSRFPELQFVPPVALTQEDLMLAHNDTYVADVLTKRRSNGFGTLSDSINASLPYTNGALYTAARLATFDKPAAALVSGFHHAGYNYGGGFCTFNGLVIAALKMMKECGLDRVLILDCDMHYGDGTDDIIRRLNLQDRVINLTFGKYCQVPKHAKAYLRRLEPAAGWVAQGVRNFQPDLILYQAGADTHVDDPFGGVLTTEQMMERDRRVFTIAKNAGIPLAWCLAGGYQRDASGGIDGVLALHMNTFDACVEIYT